MAAITLLSGINSSGLYAQYSTSALKDGDGNIITETYLSAVPSAYPTTQEVGEAIGDALDDISGTISSNYATKNYVDTEIAKVGSYTTANGAGQDLHPDVPSPSTKTIYLVKDTTATGSDKWKEWIVTGTETTGWELIGDTSMSLAGYATETWVGDNYVSKTSTAGWDVTPYTGDDGIEVSNNVISISANYLSANALDTIAGVSGNWNSAAQAVETSSTTWNSVTAKTDSSAMSGYVTTADNQTLSSNVATMAAASADWNKVSDKLDSTAAADTYLTKTDASTTYALKTDVPTTVAELTDSGNYYLKTETSGSTELTNAFNAKQDTLTFTYATVGE